MDVWCELPDKKTILHGIKAVVRNRRHSNSGTEK